MTEPDLCGDEAKRVPALQRTRGGQVDWIQKKWKEGVHCHAHAEPPDVTTVRWQSSPGAGQLLALYHCSVCPLLLFEIPPRTGTTLFGPWLQPSGFPQGPIDELLGRPAASFTCKPSIPLGAAWQSQ